jgi:outer membrane immunogenic protein
MRRRLLVANVLAAVMSVGAAQAADMPLKAAPPVVAPAFSWTGFYIGAHCGYGWGQNDWSDSYDPLNPTTLQEDDAAYDIDGGLAGGQIGFNYQVNQFVVGVEADVSWADITGKGKYYIDDNDLVGSCIQSNDACTTKIDALGTITGRIGFALDHSLLYVKGGAAWANTRFTSGYTDENFPDDNYHASSEKTRWGWTIGVGAEYAFAENWSLKVEYNYIDLGDDNVTFDYDAAPIINPYRATVDQQLNIVKAGINYRF